MHVCKKCRTFAGEMKKSIRNTINVILGVMVALLSGLFAQRLCAKCRPVEVKYGGPSPEYRDGKKKPDQPEIIVADKDSVQKQDTIQPAEPDTTILPPPPEQPLCKYGPPSDWW